MQNYNEFHSTLVTRVNKYFEDNNLNIKWTWKLYIKTIIGLVIFIVSYVFLVFFSNTLIEGIVWAFLLTEWAILIAFNAMHDGAHDAYSNNKFINQITGGIINILGSHVFLWKYKHNVLHHTYTNIDGKDDDITSLNFLRLTPYQKWHFWHRYQFIYWPFIYGFITLGWIISDFFRIIKRKIWENKLPKLHITTLISFFWFKSFYFFISIILPVFYHSFWSVIIFFLGIHILFWLSIGLIFSLAHIYKNTKFPTNINIKEKMKTHFLHQLETTQDFSPQNPILNWYMGGLNNQVAHHLFPHISHIHYPWIQKIIEKTCEEFQVSYHCQKSFLWAIWSHIQHLWKMSKKPA